MRTVTAQTALWPSLRSEVPRPTDVSEVAAALAGPAVLDEGTAFETFVQFLSDMI